MTRALKAAVIGSPVGHSLSPLIHNYWLAYYALPGKKYVAQEIQPGQLKEELARLMGEGYTGFSVTIPHKQAVMEFCNLIDDTARRIGAVNCLTVDGNGAITGLNTDWFGFIESVREVAPGFDFGKKTALVLGAGGAARAIVYGLQQSGAKKVIIVNRTAHKAAALAADFGAEAAAWEGREALAAESGIVINTTAAGMTGKPPLEFDASALPKDALVCDIVYNPLETTLLRAARERGNVTVGGLGMLLHQARQAFERWTGILPEVTDELRQKLREKLAA